MPKKKRGVFAFLLIELVLVLLLVYQFFQIFKMNFVTQTFSLTQNLFDLILAGILIILLLMVFGIQKKKRLESYLLQSEANNLINETIKRKLKETKEDPRLAALLLLEFAFILMIVATIAAYFDPEWAIIDWKSRGIDDSLATVLNAIIGIVIIVLFLFMYNFTKNYRFTERKIGKADVLEQKMLNKIKRKKPKK